MEIYGWIFFILTWAFLLMILVVNTRPISLSTIQLASLYCVTTIAGIVTFVLHEGSATSDLRLSKSE